MERLRKSDADMAEAVGKILTLGRDKITDITGTPARNIKSEGRMLANWEALWGKWSIIISELGDEAGRYAYQENSWEAPYFDGPTLAADLETGAAQMLDCIDEVYDLVQEPDLFRDALEQIVLGIRDYPEWMGAEYQDGCDLEANTTRCVLKWYWLGAKNEVNAGGIFLEKIFSLGKSIDLVSLDREECISFFSSLPEEVCRHVHTCLGGERDRFDVEMTYSLWHDIFHMYSGRFDPAEFLKTCRTHLAKNWRYGPPLVNDIFQKEDFAQTESCLVDTFSTFLHLADGKVWYPEDCLLGNRFLCRERDPDISTMLEIWSKAAASTGNPGRSAAARLQRIIFMDRQNWDAVADAYKEESGSEIQKFLEPLIREWTDEMASSSVRMRIAGKTPHWYGWVHWLIEILLDPAVQKEAFFQKLEAWLNRMASDKKIFREQWPLLARLTKDLSETGNLEMKHPAFCKAVLSGEPDDRMLDKCRREALCGIEADRFFPAIMEIWKSRISDLIPDPSQASGSNYESHAKWMKALLELNCNEYHRTLVKWREVHKRRRNLWRDLQAAGLPLQTSATDTAGWR